MKKLFAVLFIVALAAGSVTADVSLDLKGTIGQTLTLTGLGGTKNLVLNADGLIVDAALGTFTITSNMKSWSVDMTSSNAGLDAWHLVSTDAVVGDSSIPYQLKIALGTDLATKVTNNLAAYGIPGASGSTSPIYSTTHRTKKAGETFSLLLQTVPSDTGTYDYDYNFVYEDTVTLTIVNNG